MARLLFIFLFSSLLFSCGDKKQNIENKKSFVVSDIVGGVATKENEFNNVVIFAVKQESLCTGSFIKKDEILIAAHCILPFDTFLDESDLGNMYRAAYGATYAMKLFPGQYDEVRDGKYKIYQEFLKRELTSHEIEKLESLISKEVINYGMPATIIIGNPYQEDKKKGTVKDIIISPVYIKKLMMAIYRGAVFLPEAQELSFHDSDIAKVVLTKKYDHINPIAPISKEELVAEDFSGAAVKAVGWGTKADPALVSQYRQMLSYPGFEKEFFLLRNKDNLLEAHIKSDQLREDYPDLDLEQETIKNLLELRKLVPSMINLLRQPLSKHKVDLKIASLKNAVVSFESPDHSYKGICSGDSGGPIFVKLKDSGELRQISVNSTALPGCIRSWGTVVTEIIKK